MIVCFVDIGRTVDHHCLEVIVCFVDIGRIVYHHCLEVIVCFVDIGGTVDHNCLSVFFIIDYIIYRATNLNTSPRLTRPLLLHKKSGLLREGLVLYYRQEAPDHRGICLTCDNSWI